MYIHVLRAELLIPGARSLKEKRRPLKSLIKHIENRFSCAVSEVDFQDLHQRSAIGIAVVGADKAHASKHLQSIREFIELNPEIAVLGITQDAFTL